MQHQTMTRPCAMAILLAFGIGAVISLPSSADAQPPRAAPAQPAEKDKKDKKEELPPEPERLTLETKDGVILSAMYYGPKKAVRDGKLTVPIILIHGWGGQGSEFDYLARGLQTYGHAIIVPDLRGHGRSTRVRIPGRDDETIDRDKINPRELANGMLQDIETVKKFLLNKNNAGEVNIEMLCVLGAEEGALIALNWAVLDWSWPQLPAYKQGQDVKAMILLSPVRSFKGMDSNQALTHPVVGRRLSALIAVGKENSSSASDAKRIFNTLERMHPTLPKDPAERAAKQDLYLFEIPTNLQGTALLAPSLPVNRLIVGFIDRRLVQQASDFSWAQRVNPLAGG